MIYLLHWKFLKHHIEIPIKTKVRSLPDNSLYTLCYQSTFPSILGFPLLYRIIHGDAGAQGYFWLHRSQPSQKHFEQFSSFVSEPKALRKLIDHFSLKLDMQYSTDNFHSSHESDSDFGLGLRTA